MADLTRADLIEVMADHKPRIVMSETKTESTGWGFGSSVGGTFLVVLLILIVIALFWGFNNHTRNISQNRLADQLYTTGVRLGQLEQASVAIDYISKSTQSRLNDFSTVQTGLVAGLQQKFECVDYKIDSMGEFVAKPNPYALAMGGCGRRGRGCGTPEFLKQATYVQAAPPTVVEQGACGNAYDA